MPELPEVETIRRNLQRNVAGGRLSDVKTHSIGLRYPFPDAFTEGLDGAVLTRIDRRAKILLLHLDNGCVWVTHLGMTGHFAVERVAAHGSSAQDVATRKFLHFDCIVHTSDGAWRLSYYDQRRFGYMLLISETDLHAADWYKELGIEPLSDEFTVEYLINLAGRRKVDVKSLLTDQKRVAGIGNAYVCEALWTAKVLPDRQVALLKEYEASAIVDGIKSVLSDAISAGEASIGTKDETAGRDGYFDYDFKVYDREGLPCPRSDGGTIDRITAKGRSTYFCTICQQ